VVEQRFGQEEQKSDANDGAIRAARLGTEKGSRQR